MLKSLAYLLCRVFFRDVHVSGTPTVSGSSIWLANHTSGIVDPMVMFGLCPLPLRPIAKHTLWDYPVMRVLLGWARAIPVFRAQDMKADESAKAHVGEIQDDRHGNAAPALAPSLAAATPAPSGPSNAQALEAAAQALRAGDCVLIFPEGVSHDEPYLHKLKTGFARMALLAVKDISSRGGSVTIQPVAIDYFEKDEFRSDLALHFCEQVTVTSEETPVEDIVAAVSESLRGGLAAFRSWNEKRNWHFLFELAYGRPPHSARELRVFVESHRPKFDADPVFLARIQTMRRMLVGFNITPSQLIWGENHSKKRHFFGFLLKHGWFYLTFSMPVQTLTWIYWYVPYRLCGKIADKVTKERDVLATMKIATGLWLFPLWSVLVTTVLTSVIRGGGGLPGVPGGLLWTLLFVLGPVLLFMGFLCMENLNFFPGYWQLSKLRFLKPRAFRELFSEWREVSAGVLEKLDEPRLRGRPDVQLFASLP